MKNTFLFAFLLFVVFSSQISFAQIGNPGLVYQGAFNNAMFLTTKQAIEKSVGKKNTTVADSPNSNTKTAVTANLNYNSTPEVHQKVLQTIAGLAANGDKAKQAMHAKTLENAGLLAQFDKLLSAYGFNSRNLADVYAAYIILSWQATTGNDAGKYPKGLEIFRKEMLAGMGSNAAVAAFSNGQKQEMAETLSYIATIVTIAHENQLKNKDAAAIAATRQNIRNITLKATGIDILKYQLTNAGFKLL